MGRFRELRRIKFGKLRAAQFFIENNRRITHRSVLVALLFDQKDPMKRLRTNGGIPDVLAPQGIALLSGHYNAPLAKKLGYHLTVDEFVAIRPNTLAELSVLRAAGELA